MNLKEMIASKVFSARFIIAVLTTVAVCLLAGYVFRICAIKDKLDVGVAVVMSLFTAWSGIVKDYFSREDRKTESAPK